jgi:hypothetical protein
MHSFATQYSNYDYCYGFLATRTRKWDPLGPMGALAPKFKANAFKANECHAYAKIHQYCGAISSYENSYHSISLSAMNWVPRHPWDPKGPIFECIQTRGNAYAFSFVHEKIRKEKRDPFNPYSNLWTIRRKPNSIGILRDYT